MEGKEGKSSPKICHNQHRSLHYFGNYCGAVTTAAFFLDHHCPEQVRIYAVQLVRNFDGKEAVPEPWGFMQKAQKMEES
jgi:hypothetical protein